MGENKKRKDEDFIRNATYQTNDGGLHLPTNMSRATSAPMIQITDTDLSLRPTKSLPSSLGLRLMNDGPHAAQNKKLSRETKSRSRMPSLPNNEMTLNDVKPTIRWKRIRRRLLTIMWINLIMRYRSKLITFLELILPLLVMLVFLSSFMDFSWEVGGKMKEDVAAEVAAGRPYEFIKEYHVLQIFCNRIGKTNCDGSEQVLVYTPSDWFTDEIMRRAGERLGIESSSMHVAEDESELLQFCKSNYDRDKPMDDQVVPFGVVFTTTWGPANSSFPLQLKYKIRTFIKDISNTAEAFPFVPAPSEDRLVSPYVYSGFCSLQIAIDKSFMAMLLDEKKTQCACRPYVKDFGEQLDALLDTDVSGHGLQMFPFTLYLDLKVRQFTWASILLAINLGDFCTVFFCTRQIIIDLNSGMLELLRLHGHLPYMYWVSLLFHDVIIRAISCIFVTWIMFANVSTNDGLLKYDNPVLVWFFFFLHGIAKSASGFFFAIFFESPTVGGTFAFLFSFLTFFIPLNLYTNDQLNNVYLNLFLTIVFPNWCLANGLYHFLKFESFDSGVEWASASVWADDKSILIPLLYCLIIFPVTAFIYMMLTIYAHQTSEKHMSPKEDYLYCLRPLIKTLKSKWNCKCKISPDDKGWSDEFEKPPIYENDPNLPCIVKCRNITYNIGMAEVALNDVSLNFYQDQITVVLGHSGSGKTTLLHTLAGLVAPAIGKTRVLGVDPVKNKLVRRYIGFCPQKLMLFPTISVEEHLRFACMLHTTTYKKAKLLCKQLIARFNLLEYRRAGVRNLSEGQKRKLAIAMAIAANPPILILDEPTFGMEIGARKEIWDLLQFLRLTRTIIVTTCTMDEADMNADRIILLGKGNVLCCGSPSFLKLNYSTGSYLRIRKLGEKPNFANEIINFLNTKVDLEIRIHQFQSEYEDDNSAVYISLPMEKQDKFQIVIRALEENSEELGISKISPCHVTLEGIFFKLSREIHFERGAELRRGSSHSQRNLPSPVAPLSIPELPEGVKKDPNFCLTTTALFTKQILYIRQRHIVFIMEYTIPLLLVIFFVRFCDTFVTSQPEPTNRPLTISTYGEAPIPILLKIDPQYNIRYWKHAFDVVVGSVTQAKYFTNSPEDEDKTFFFEMLTPVDKSFIDYKKQVATAFSKNDSNFIALYASDALHSAPIAQNLLSNVLLYFLSSTKESNPTDVYTITTSNHPIPIYAGITTGTARDATNALGGIMFSFILALIASSNIRFCVTERITGVKDLQLMTGVNAFAYWVVIFTCDCVLHFMLSILIMVIVYLFDTLDVFSGREAKVVLFILIVMYLCWACLPYGYFISRFIGTDYNGYGLLLCIHILLGSIPVIIFHLILGNQTEASIFLLVCKHFFLAFPPYGITAAIVHFCDEVSKRTFCLRIPKDSQMMCAEFEKHPHLQHLNNNSLLTLAENDVYFHQCCDSFCTLSSTCFVETPFFVWGEGLSGSNDLSAICLAFVVQGFFYWILVLLMELDKTCSFYTSLKGHISGNLDSANVNRVLPHETEEMQIERERINLAIEFGEQAEDALLVRDVTKFFGKKRALEHVYFGAKPGEIVGILGPPESGKTVLLEIIAGQLSAARGSLVVINNVKLQERSRIFLRHLAYCPRANPILDYLTGFQMMQLVARLRGIPTAHADVHIMKWLELMGFEKEDWSRKCREYTPALQRRLVCAMTMLGDCSVLLFDAPTEVLDPLEHLIFWNLLARLQKRNQTIVFTSSRARECAKVTNKFILLREGRVYDMGSPDEIAERYSTGWTLVIRFKPDISKMGDDAVFEETQTLHEYILSIFSPCQLKQDRDSFVLYHVLESVKTLSYMYEHMESAKKQLPNLIDEFFIEESNLDDAIGNLPTFAEMFHHHSSASSASVNLSNAGSGEFAID